ncbi:hypothetical protein ACHAXR_004908 [Thalassiosira sp. AJA248-18]
MNGIDTIPTKHLRRRAAIIFFSLLLRPNQYHAFCPRSPRRLVLRHQRHQYIEWDGSRTKLYQLGSGDYLSKISANNNQQNDGQTDESYNSNKATTDKQLAAAAAPPSKNIRRSNNNSPIMANVKSAFSSVSNEVEKRTSEISSGFASVAERGGSDIQSLATKAKDGAGWATKKGTRDIKRSTLQAQKVVKRTTGSFAAVTTGQGLSDIHFFQEVSSFSPKLQAEEVAKWIDSQAKSGSEMVGSKAKTLVLNFTGKGEYQFGDVTKELIHRVSSQEVSMQDTILLLKILLALGATIGPLADLLPFTFLIEALNISLEQKVGGKILEVLSKTLDNRLVAALFTADDQNLIGDVAKRTVLGGVLEFTGKSNYKSGDIQRAVQLGQEEDSMDDMKLELDLSEFEEWDRRFVENIETEDYVGNQAKILDMKIAMALEECEEIAQRKNDFGS